MFTLKLYRRACPAVDNSKMHKVIAVNRVVVIEIGKKALEIHAFTSPTDYESYYIGEPEQGMDAYGKDDLHIGTDARSWWGWGLLENWEGNTSEHYRPAGYG